MRSKPFEADRPILPSLPFIAGINVAFAVGIFFVKASDIVGTSDQFIIRIPALPLVNFSFVAAALLAANSLSIKPCLNKSATNAA
ncbi:hypothetical protein D3C85_1768460 [compost metagenome]